MTLNGEITLISRYFTKFGSFRGALRNSDWQSLNYGQLTITMSSSIRLQRDVRRPRYKYSITARWKFCSRFINSRLNAQYLPSYRLDRKSYISFRLVPKSVTLNDLERRMALILRYFTEFGSFLGALHKGGCHSHNYEQFTITMSSSKRLQKDRATPPV